ncbi:MAG: DUF4249 domain-containing protein, partial [Cytophagales bacterium]|nr:DUF4249 domain-containing protein [Cytophagales bacterium]
MDKTKVLSLVCLAVLLLNSCIDEVQLPIRNETPKLVVEGMITNEPGPYRVRLTYSGEFLSAGELPPELSVSNAEVFISDDVGNRTRLLSLRNPGFYETTDSSFVGRVGRSYTLSVRLPDGRRYVSKPEKMLPVPPIDTVYAEFVTINNPGRNYAYDIYIDTRDAPNTRDYYRWTAYSYHLHRS